MKSLPKAIVALSTMLFILGCASQEEAPQADATVQVVEEGAPEQPVSTPGPLDEARIAAFESGDGTSFEDLSIVTLPTGGPPAGRLVPTSSNPDVTLYVTRDGSVPSAANNWGGAIDPANPIVISRPLEGTASYRVVAELDGEYSDPFTLTVVWKHEEAPQLAAPVFRVGGDEVTGSVTIPVSDGTRPSDRLEISCGYVAATLYITRDGSAPSADSFWRTQVCDGTFIWSPEPTAAEYRVVAVWQGVQSPVASLAVEWK